MTDLDAMLARDDIQIVNVCVPSGLHAEIGIKAAQAGKHVICEKPIDITLDAADRLIAACDGGGREVAGDLAASFRRGDAAAEAGD